MSDITYKSQSIKISIRSNTTSIVAGDYINLYGGILTNPSLIDYDTPLLSNIKPSNERTDNTNPSLPITYRDWDIYYVISAEGLYQFDYKIFDKYNNVGSITDNNPSDEPENFNVCLTPKQATTPYDAELVDDTGSTSTLTLSF